MRTVAVLGAGNMGTALAQTMAGNGRRARLWSIEADVLEEMRDRRLNSKYLPGVPLHENVTPCWTIEEALAGAWLVLFSVPSHIVRGLVRDVAPHISGEQAVLNAGKGLEEGTDKRMSEVLAEEMPRSGGIAAMGGPAIATEFARGVPTAVIVAGPGGAPGARSPGALPHPHPGGEAVHGPRLAGVPAHKDRGGRRRLPRGEGAGPPAGRVDSAAARHLRRAVPGRATVGDYAAVPARLRLRVEGWTTPYSRPPGAPRAACARPGWRTSRAPGTCARPSAPPGRPAPPRPPHRSPSSSP